MCIRTLHTLRCNVSDKDKRCNVSDKNEKMYSNVMR